MAKGCCYKQKTPKGQVATVERDEADSGVVLDRTELDTIASFHSRSTAPTVPSHLGTVNSPRRFPLTRTKPAMRPAPTGLEMSASNTSLHRDCSAQSLSHKQLTSHIHELISRQSAGTLGSSVDGGEGHSLAPVIHGLTDENKETYQATLRMLAEVPDWECGYESADPPGKLLYKMDPGNKVGWMYMAMVLPCPLVATLAPTLEVDTWTKWHPYCTKHEKTGDSSTWHCQSHFEQSMAFGAFKMDQNVRVERWVNESDGFFLQSLTTLKPEDIGYVKPRMNRNQVEGAVLTLSPSPNETLMLQLLRFETPIAIPHFIQKFVFGTVAPKLLTQLITNASHVQDPKYPYQERIEEDKCGIYAYLSKLALSDSPKPLSIIESTHALLGGDVMHGRAIKTIQSETRRANKKKEKKKGKTQKKSARSLDN
eukprot:GEMP01023378.1.p1 GENE.GEMP01023378.1~~GEMP01023378.1.p1  ORF type:complete len:425 (+),score=85.26 GEMP01023378.1:90-1364(+)